MQSGSALGKLGTDTGIAQEFLGGFIANFLQMPKSKNAHNIGGRSGQEEWIQWSPKQGRSYHFLQVSS